MRYWNKMHDEEAKANSKAKLGSTSLIKIPIKSPFIASLKTLCINLIFNLLNCK